MKEPIARVVAFVRAFSTELDRVLPRPVVPLAASLAIHLALAPFIFLVMLFTPEPVQDRVFMLEGGLALGDGLDSGWDDDDDDDDDDDWDLDDEDEEEDEDWDEDAVDTSDPEKFDRWGFPLPGAFDDEDDEDDDWDSNWFTKKKWTDDEDDEDWDDEDIIDDDLDEDDEDEDEDFVNLDEYDIDIEDDERDEEAIKEQIESFGPDKKKWESLFADAEEETPQKPPKIKAKTSAIDEKILAFIERNPYEDLASGNDAVPDDIASGVDFADFDARLPELLDWMPPDSLMAALISLELLRARPDREELEKTLKSLGYFRQIAGGSELSFFDDIDAVLIASNDPLDVRETFVILRHSLDDEKVHDAIDKQFESLKLESNWYEVDGRSVVQPDKESFDKLPWIYFLPRPGFVAVLHASKRDRLTTYMGSESFGPGASARLMGDLERHMRFGLVAPMIQAGIVDIHGNPAEGVEPMPVAVVLGAVMFADAFKEVVDGSSFPAPGEVMLMGRFGEDGEIEIEGSADFSTEDEVDMFFTQWLKAIEPLRTNILLKLIGAVDLIDLARWKRADDGRVELHADVAPDEVARLMALVRLLTAEPADKLDDEA
ncbi:MAG: hypothetical protein JRG91_17115, partial [Deltaproteobacteria bacterium]|nr:hypothetical protein [Deltaproteobacteria bacterium]